MDLLELWGLARRNWLLLLASLLGGLALAAGYSYVQPVLYSATATGYVVAGNSATVGDAFAGSNLAAEKAETYLPLVKSQAVAERVAEELDVPSLAEIGGSLEGEVTGSVIFTITATADSPERARDLADAALAATSAEAVVLETLTPSGAGGGDTVIRIVPVKQADVPTQPVSPNWNRNLALGLLLGLMVGFGVVVLRHTFDRRVRQASDVEEITDSSALGVIPRADELVTTTTLAGDRGAAAEAMRQFRTNLRFVSVDKPPRSIVVTSPNQGEGKSTIATHLASLLAESGQPTVLIDADLRRPRLAKLFEVDGTVGLTQVVAGSVDLADALVPTPQPDLFLLPAGRIPPNPSELVGSGRMQSLITTLSQTYYVIIDAPPLLPVTDAGLLTVASDGAVLVIQTGKTRTEQVALAARNLANVDGTLLGFVMNMVSRKDLGSVVYGYGHGSYSSHYYYGEDDGRGRVRRRERYGKRAQAARHAGSGAGAGGADHGAGGADSGAGASGAEPADRGVHQEPVSGVEDSLEPLPAVWQSAPSRPADAELAPVSKSKFPPVR